MPEPQERLRLLDEIRKLKAEGKNHSECLQYLLSRGLRKGFAEGMLIDIEREQPPDLEKRNTFKWNGWYCEYPGNWKECLIDDSIPRNIATGLEGIGSGSVLFFMQSENYSYHSIITENLSLLKDVKEYSIQEWGNMKGEGKLIKGILIIGKLPTEMIVFHVSDIANPIVVVQSCAIEEKEIINPAFDLIQSTFSKMKK